MIKRIIPSNDGVVGIVTAFLIVGLIVIVFSVVQTVYVPQWMKDNEADHMEVVADQFSKLKFAIDTHCQFEDENNPITTSITLGNKEMPVLSSSRSYGSIEILPEQFIISISGVSFPTSITALNTLKYSSSNAYFLDQEYIFEAGAIILSQYQGDTMVIKPSFSVDNNKTDDFKFNISIDLIDIIPVDDENYVSGYGSYPIKTQFDSVDEFAINGISNLTIQTEFPVSWERFLNNSFKQAELKFSKDPYDIHNETFYFEKNGGQIKVIFGGRGSDIRVNVNVRITKISAQISQGWIN